MRVGDRAFNDAVIGSARDELRVCIDAEVNGLAGSFGVVVKNVAIPNVILAPEVQVSLDAITQSRLDTVLAAQDAIKAKEQAAADQAREEGAVRVTLSRQQEEVRQQTILADLQRQRFEANRAVIEAESLMTCCLLKKTSRSTRSRLKRRSSKLASTWRRTPCSPSCISPTPTMPTCRR